MAYTSRSVLEGFRDRFVPQNLQERAELLAKFTISPAIFFLIVFVFLPVIYTVYLSFTNANIISPTEQLIGIDQYVALVQMDRFYASLWKGILFTGGSLVIQLGIGLLVALVLRKKFFGSSLARTLAIFPYLVPTISVAIMWEWLLTPPSGMVNYYLVELGVLNEYVSFFGNADLAMLVLIVANSWKFTAFVVVIFIARLQAIPDSMYESAWIAGASPLQTFRDITLPQLRSAFLLVLLLRGIWQFNKFDIVFLLTRGGPVNATETLPVLLYKTAFQRFDLGLAAAMAVAMFLITASVSVLYFYYLRPSEEIKTTR